MEINDKKLGDLLTKWLSVQSSIDNVKGLALELEYDDPLPSAAKDEFFDLTGELIIANTSLVIFAINQTFDTEKAKKVVESLLIILNETLFTELEQQAPEFKEKYEQRAVQYFEILHQGNPFVEFPAAFLSNLDENLPNNMKNQQVVFEMFDELLNKTVDVLRLMDFRI